MDTGAEAPADHGVTRFFVVAWVAWGAALLLHLHAFSVGFTFDALTAAEERRIVVDVLLALALSLRLPFVAFVLAVANRRTVAAVTLGVALVLAAVPAVVAAPDLARGWRDRVDPAPTPTLPTNYCAEFSGDGNECPGG